MSEAGTNNRRIRDGIPSDDERAYLKIFPDHHNDTETFFVIMLDPDTTGDDIFDDLMGELEKSGIDEGEFCAEVEWLAPHPSTESSSIGYMSTYGGIYDAADGCINDSRSHPQPNFL